MANKNTIITGGAGFIGTNLIKRLLSEDNRVICVDNLFSGHLFNLKQFRENPNFNFIQTDIINKDSFDAINPGWDIEFDQIYHLACPASPPYYQVRPLFTLKTCFQGTYNVLEFARERGIRVLFSSTSEIYGDPLEHPQTESYRGNVNTVGPRSCYDEGKRVAESLCYEFFQKEGVDVRVVRIFNSYGPFMDSKDGRVVSNIINQALNEKDITIYGTGKQTRSFCYVDDLVDGLIKDMNFGNLDEKCFGPINLGNPQEFTINELAERVKKLIPEYKGKIEYKELPKDDPTRRKPDISRAREILGWEPKISLEEGLVKTIEYFRKLNKE